MNRPSSEAMEAIQILLKLGYIDRITPGNGRFYPDAGVDLTNKGNKPILVLMMQEQSPASEN